MQIGTENQNYNENLRPKAGHDLPVHRKVRFDPVHADGDKGSDAITTDVVQTVKDGSFNIANDRSSKMINTACVPASVSPDAGNREGYPISRTVTGAFDKGEWVLLP